MVPGAAEDGMGNFKEKETSWDACSLWRTPKDQAGRFQEADISALRFISRFSNLRDQHDYLHSHWSLSLCYGTAAGFLGPGAKTITGRRSWLDFIAKGHFRVFRTMLHLLLINKLRPRALGRELNTRLAPHTRSGVPVSGDRDVHSASCVATAPPSSSMPK